MDLVRKCLFLSSYCSQVPGQITKNQNDPVSLVFHQLGLHLTHGGVEVVLDDLADLGRDLRLELLHELGAVVVHIPEQHRDE